jgi:hypothetical protein
MEIFGLKARFGTVEGIIVAKVDEQFEIAALIGSILRSNDVYQPLSEIFINQSSCYTLNGLINIQIIEFLYNSLLVQSVLPS